MNFVFSPELVDKWPPFYVQINVEKFPFLRPCTTRMDGRHFYFLPSQWSVRTTPLFSFFRGRVAEFDFFQFSLFCYKKKPALCTILTASVDVRQVFFILLKHIRLKRHFLFSRKYIFLSVVSACVICFSSIVQLSTWQARKNHLQLGRSFTFKKKAYQHCLRKNHNWTPKYIKYEP